MWHAGWDPTSARSAAAGIAVTNIGAQIIAIQPTWVQALTEHAGLAAPAAGYVTSFEMQGIALAALVLALVVGRIPWRPTFVLALGLVAAGNLLTVAVAADPSLLRAMRFLTGIGAGTCVSLGFTAIGRTLRPDRNFGLCITVVLVYAAVVMSVAPALLASLGIAGLCVLMGVLAAAGLLAVPSLPPAGTTSGEPPAGSVADPGLLRRLSGLAAMFAYFLAQGAFWSYAALIGTAGGLREQAVANYLAVSQFAGIAGALASVMLGTRYGRAWPLTAGILLGIFPVLALSGDFRPATFAAAMLVYQFGWNLTHPYLLAVMSRFCGTGRHVTYAVVMHKLGLALGPALAAAALEAGGFRRVILLSVGSFTAALLLVLWPVRRQSEIQSQAAAGPLPAGSGGRAGV